MGTRKRKITLAAARSGFRRTDRALFFEVFDGLTARQWDYFTSIVTLRKYSRKETVFHQGTNARGLYTVMSGKVKVFSRDSNGREVIVDIICGGGGMGLAALITAEKYHLSAETLEEAEIWFLRKEAFFQLLDQSVPFERALLRALAGQVHARTDLVCSYIQKTVRERVAGALLLMEGKVAATSRGAGEKRILLRREDLASYAGTTLESAVRCLSDFKRDGVIRVDGREIAVLNQEGLDRIAQGSER